MHPIQRPLPLILLLTLAIATLSAGPAAAGWTVDPNHSKIGFSVKHFFTPVKGSFDEFDIQLTYDADNPANSSVEVTIQVASVNTGNERRDNHLRSADFFDVANHPTITFKSNSVRVDGDRLIATGPLTIKGITEEIDLPVDRLGIQELPEPMQQALGGATQVAGFAATTTIDRGDFDVGTGNWAATVVVGADVDVEIDVEAHLR